MRDTKPSLRTITGDEAKVLNLRPLEKDKHLDKVFCHGPKTDYEKFQYQNFKDPHKYFDNDKLGLPSINK